MATFSLVGLAQSDYKYEKPAGADNFYHTYNASEQQVSFLNQYKMKVVGTFFVPYTIKEGGTVPNLTSQVSPNTSLYRKTTAHARKA